MQASELISTAETARLLGKSVATINRWVVLGKIKPAHEMPGETGARLFRRSDVERIVAKRAQAAA